MREDKDKILAGFFLQALKAGYKVTFEGPVIGKDSGKSHLHLGMCDELKAHQEHHCGFDFRAYQATAKCTCGNVSTNPYYQGPR